MILEAQKKISSLPSFKLNLPNLQPSWIYKIVPRIAKIFVYRRILTNVTRTNVAWANVPNILDRRIFVNLGYMPNFSFLGYAEVRKKDVLRVGGWFWVENNATLWLHLAS